MKSDVKKAILNELKVIIIAFILFYLFFQIHYYKENIFLVLKMAIAHFYLFIIPGYSICLLFYGKIGQIERLIIGTGSGYGLQSFLLYFINMTIKVKIKEYYLYVSAILIIIGVIIFYFRTLRKP
ncbi:hypothetical protein JW851_04510 [Candidatus Woesearchaeota archaeon]|nr:hypothetical protein [Candidatus Woesearchaeota archaeon]